MGALLPRLSMEEVAYGGEGEIRNGKLFGYAVREVYFAHTKGLPITESLQMLEQFRSELRSGLNARTMVSRK